MDNLPNENLTLMYTEEPVDESPVNYHEEVVGHDEEETYDHPHSETPIIDTTSNDRAKMYYIPENDERVSDNTWMYASLVVIAIFLFFMIKR